MAKNNHNSEKGLSAWDEDDTPKKICNKWEITPRTATQSASLRWDQTPLGVLKVGEGFNNVRGDWDDEITENLVKKITIREINMCLPNDGYDIHVFLEEHSIAGDDLFIKPEEDVFFGAIYESNDLEEVEALKLLLQIKNGNKKALKQIKHCNKNMLLEKAIMMVLSLNMKIEEKRRFLKLVYLILRDIEIETLPYIKELLYIIGSWIDNTILRSQSLEALEPIFARGKDYMLEVIEDDLRQANTSIREAVAQIIAAMWLFYGIAELKDFLEALTVSQFYEVKCTFCQVIIKICVLQGKAVLENLQFLCDCLITIIRDNNRYLKADAGNAASMLLSTIHPYRGPETTTLFDTMLYEIKSTYPIPSVMKAMAYLCEENKEFAEQLFDILKRRKKFDGDTVKILDRICSNIEGAMSYFNMHINALMHSKTNKNVLVNLCTKMCKENADMLLPYFAEQELMGIVAIVYTRIVLEFEDVERYYDSLRNAVKCDCQEVVDNFDKLFQVYSVKECYLNRELPLADNQHTESKKQSSYDMKNSGLSGNFISTNRKQNLWSRGQEAEGCIDQPNRYPQNQHEQYTQTLESKKVYTKTPIDEEYISGKAMLFYKDCLEYIHTQESKTKGIKILGQIARHLNRNQQTHFGNILLENITETDTNILSCIIEAMVRLYNVIKFKPAQEIIPNLLPVLKVKDDAVLYQTLELVSTICRNSSLECEKRSIREWMRIVYEITDSFGTWNRQLKHRLSEVLSEISKIVGPQEVLNVFMTNVVSEDRNIRSNTCIGISILSKACGGFFVFPALIAEYVTPNLRLQMGILKTISLCTDIEPYINSLMPLIEDALMESDIAYRRYGIAIATKALIKSSEICIHLLNMLWVNVFEASLENEFNEFIKAATEKLGGQIMFRYIAQGILHPATKVRKRYLRLLDIIAEVDSEGIAFCLKSVRRKG